MPTNITAINAPSTSRVELSQCDHEDRSIWINGLTLIKAKNLENSVKNNVVIPMYMAQKAAPRTRDRTECRSLESKNSNKVNTLAANRMRLP